MLKQIEMYRVDVKLNDGSRLPYTLFSKPDAYILSEVAAVQNDPDFERVVALVGSIDTPALGEDAAETIISVGGTIIGTIDVCTEVAYGVPVKRGRKPKVVDPCPCADACSDCTGANCEE
jgi:hypothetical protein